jgi:hypothetical protein
MRGREEIGGEDGYVISGVYRINRCNKGFGERAGNFDGIPHVEAFRECCPD